MIPVQAMFHVVFDRPEEPVTLTQLSRGRAELAYLTALEGIALDLGKLVFDLTDKPDML